MQLPGQRIASDGQYRKTGNQSGDHASRAGPTRQQVERRQKNVHLNFKRQAPQGLVMVNPIMF